MSACIFCGRTPTTNAHVFRKAWLDLVFPGTEKYQHRHVRRGRGGSETTWAKDEADIKVNCVCKDCNGGWMNQLDREAKRIFLDHAVRGFDVRLDTMQDKTLLARWCALVAVLGDQTQAEPVVTSSAHQTLFRGDVPEGTVVWLLRTEPPAWQVSAWLESRSWQFRDPSERPADAYFVTFGVNHLVAQVFVPTERAPTGIEFTREPNAALLKTLWPPPLTPLIWPPPNSFVWEERPELADAFQGASWVARLGGSGSSVPP